jgi:hypothetical protein
VIDPRRGGDFSVANGGSGMNYTGLSAILVISASLAACRGDVALGDSGGDSDAATAGSPEAGGIVTEAAAPAPPPGSDGAATGISPSSSPDATTYLADGASADAMTNVADGASAGDGESPIDAAALPVPAAGVAGFAFLVNGVVQVPMSCPSEAWEFPPAPQIHNWDTLGDTALCGVDSGVGLPVPPCPGATSVVLVNTGEVPLAYFASTEYTPPTIPGVLQSGDNSQLVGVLNPGEQVDITSVFVGGSVAVLGSAEPFSGADASYASDEGMIPWPGGVAGSLGSSQMYIAEIEVFPACRVANQDWL